VGGGWRYSDAEISTSGNAASALRFLTTMRRPSLRPDSQIDQLALDVRFPALDGFDLGGRLYRRNQDDSPPVVTIFLSGGGVLALRYRRFAAFLASKGIPVLSFDYRGIGASRRSSLRGMSASAEDWGKLDVGGAIAELASRFPNARLACISHSIGALLLGAAPNAKLISDFVFLSPHTGYWGDYNPKYRVPMFALWHVAMPITTYTLGYFPGKFLGLGEDIPAGVALDWSRRRNPQIARSPSNRDLLSRFAEVRGQAFVMTPLDDGFATKNGADRLLSLYPNLSTQRVNVDPKALGVAHLGHFGFFRRERAVDLWLEVVGFLDSAKPSIGAVGTSIEPVH
jgi:predicted alpha/beta hydrolase